MTLSSSMPPAVAGVDAVVIGRNEGARLVACLGVLRGQVWRIVYVDSGSTDGSVAAAEALGAEVVTLDMARPFTAARARNAGLVALALGGNAAEFVQMIDGDCALRAGWLAVAVAFLQADPKAALVFGRRRERFPAASVYNQLCDREWDVPLGEVRACGGDMLIRRAALAEVGGYREEVIAAEDDEKLAMIRGLTTPITVEMVIQEINRYADSEFRYADKSDEVAIAGMVRDYQRTEEAKRRYLEGKG